MRGQTSPWRPPFAPSPKRSRGESLFDSLVGRDADNLSRQFPDAYVLGLGGPMQDGDELYNLVSSKGRGLYCKNEKVDRLFDQGRSTMDPGRRRRIYRDLARTMIEDATWVFLMQQVDIYAVRDRAVWTPRPDQWMDFSNATLK